MTSDRFDAVQPTGEPAADTDQRADGPSEPLDAQRAAANGEGESAEGGSARHLVFRLGETLFAAPLEELVEVGEVPPTTWMPNVPPWILGLINLRGEVLPLVELADLLGLEVEAPASGARLLVVRSAEDQVRAGFLVSDVIGVRRLGQEDGWLVGGREFGDRSPSVLYGVAELEGRKVGVIDCTSLLLEEAASRLDQGPVGTDRSESPWGVS